MRIRQLITVTGTAGLLVALGVATPAASAPLSSSIAIDFSGSGYTVAPLSPAGQNGWSGTRTDVDFALVDNTSFPAAGLPAGRSVQFSNYALRLGSAHLVSPLIAPAGEPTTNALVNTFDVTFTVASATGAVQPGLGVDVNIDGASRFGGVVNLRHSDTGLQVGSYWVPYGATAAGTNDWRSAVFATVPADVPHTIRVVAMFLPGQADLFDVYVDGVLVSGGSGVTTWEAYSTITGGGGDRSVDSISFKTSSSAPSADGIGYVAAPAAPDTLDLGFLFTGISYSTRADAPPAATAPPVLPVAPDPAPDTEIAIADDELSAGDPVTFTAEGFTPYENVYATIFSAPVFAGWFQADALGRVSGSFAVPAGLPAGTHTLQLNGSLSGNTAAVGFSLLALAATGVEAPVLLAGSAALLLAGLVMVVTRRRTVDNF